MNRYVSNRSRNDSKRNTNISDRNNNFVFKRLLAITGIFDKNAIMKVFEVGGYTVNKSQIQRWKTIKESERKQTMPKEALNAFLNGLLILSEKGDLWVGFNIKLDDNP